MAEQMTYEQTMQWGSEQYRDVLHALGSADLAAEFVQTGGMCAAITVSLDGGGYLLLTDRDETLSWEREQHLGWFCGLYESEERRKTDGPMRWLEDTDGSAETAVTLCRRVLRGETSD